MTRQTYGGRLGRGALCALTLSSSGGCLGVDSTTWEDAASPSKGAVADASTPDASAPEVTPRVDPDATAPSIPDVGALPLEMMPDGSRPTAPRTVFMIVLGGQNWSAITPANAPYIHKSLLPLASSALNYRTPTTNTPDGSNYLWLEAGQNFGIASDGDPSINHQTSPNHFVRQLTDANISWKAYEEDIDGQSCPLSDTREYVASHNPMVFFDDVTDRGSLTSANCIRHVRPYTELAQDLAKRTVARFNLITPNLCHDMVGDDPASCPGSVAAGDAWLATEVPKLLASAAYRQNGVLFILWIEGGDNAGTPPVTADAPIGMLVLSRMAKGGGYSNQIPYTHSSTLKTLQEMFGVGPLLADAANATDLRDLFRTFP